MDSPVVEALLGTFGPFVFPVVLFAGGAVGYGVLLLAGRLSAPEEPAERQRATSGVGEDSTEGPSRGPTGRPPAVRRDSQKHKKR